MPASATGQTVTQTKGGQHRAQEGRKRHSQSLCAVSALLGHQEVANATAAASSSIYTETLPTVYTETLPGTEVVNSLCFTKPHVETCCRIFFPGTPKNSLDVEPMVTFVFTSLSDFPKDLLAGLQGYISRGACPLLPNPLAPSSIVPYFGLSFCAVSQLDTPTCSAPAVQRPRFLPRRTAFAPCGPTLLEQQVRQRLEEQRGLRVADNPQPVSPFALCPALSRRPALLFMRLSLMLISCVAQLAFYGFPAARPRPDLSATLPTPPAACVARRPPKQHDARITRRASA